MRLVEQAQQSKSDTQILADRAAGWLLLVALAVAVLIAVGWLVARGWDLVVLQRVVAVLVIACPYALGPAVPLVVAISTSLGARNGILVRDRMALEDARELDTVIFDKTGTLTKSEFGVVDIAVSDTWDEDRALSLAAAFDAAVATFVFCSIPDAVQGLQEVKRVVRQGGQVLLLEHVRVNAPVIETLMDLMDPISVRVMGPHIARRTAENVVKAGLSIEKVEVLAPGALVKLIHARVA